MNSLRVYSPQNLALTPLNEISVYSGPLTTESIIKEEAKIKKAFPSLPIDFFDVFTDRIRENGFTDTRLKDAVNFVIDNCVYPTPTIAQFISYDKKFKCWSYEEMMKKWDEFGPELANSYKPIQFPDREKPVWVHVDDIKKYNLESSKT
jgi:hypothetical protein